MASGVMRLDLLKVVGSSPAFLAKPEAERPARLLRPIARGNRDQSPAFCCATMQKSIGIDCLITTAPPSLMSCTKTSIGVSVAANDFATIRSRASVHGRRA